jgi:uncharacterized protein YlzI (FlbEa/FlbD family)
MESSGKNITLASFVYQDKIGSFKNYLYKRFGIKEKNIFQYNFEEVNKKILTFMVKVEQDQKVETSSFFPSTIIVHKKGECFYTINALNKLIEKISSHEVGNLDYKNVIVNWDDYQNKMILVKNDELKIIDIKKHFS